jgi:hypothetical protein
MLQRHGLTLASGTTDGVVCTWLADKSVRCQPGMLSSMSAYIESILSYMALAKCSAPAAARLCEMMDAFCLWPASLIRPVRLACFAMPLMQQRPTCAFSKYALRFGFVSASAFARTTTWISARMSACVFGIPAFAAPCATANIRAASLSLTYGCLPTRLISRLAARSAMLESGCETASRSMLAFSWLSLFLPMLR